MSKNLHRHKRQKPSPAKVALAFNCIIDQYRKNSALDKRLLAEMLGVTSSQQTDDLKSAKATAEQLAIAEKTLAHKRVAGDVDLPHVKIGSRVYYKQADIAAYIERNIRISTSDIGGVK